MCAEPARSCAPANGAFAIIKLYASKIAPNWKTEPKNRNRKLQHGATRNALMSVCVYVCVRDGWSFYVVSRTHGKTKKKHDPCGVFVCGWLPGWNRALGRVRLVARALCLLPPIKGGKKTHKVRIVAVLMPARGHDMLGICWWVFERMERVAKRGEERVLSPSLCFTPQVLLMRRFGWARANLDAPSPNLLWLWWLEASLHPSRGLDSAATAQEMNAKWEMRRKSASQPVSQTCEGYFCPHPPFWAFL